MEDPHSPLLKSIISILGSDPLKQVTRLLKYEQKFTDLTAAYKSLVKKSTTIDKLLISHFQLSSLDNQHDLDILSQTLQKSQSIHQTTRLELEKTKVKLATLSDTEQSLIKYQNISENLNSELIKAQNQIKSYSTQSHNQSNSEIHQLQESLNTLRNDQKIANEFISNLEFKIKDLEKENQILTLQLSTVKGIATGLTTELKNAKTIIENQKDISPQIETTSKTLEFEKRFAELEERNKLLNNSFKESEASLKLKNAHILQLEQELQNLKNFKSNKLDRNSIEKSLVEKAQLEHDLRVANDSKKYLESEISHLKNMILEKDLMCKTINEQLENERIDFEKGVSDRVEIQKEYNEVKLQLFNLHQEKSHLENLASGKFSLETKNRDFEIELVKLQKLLSEKEKVCLELNRKNQEFSKELNSEKKTLQEQNHQINRLNETVNTLQNDILKQKNSYDNIIKNLEESLQKTSNDLENALSGRGTIDSDFNQATEELIDLRFKISNLEILSAERDTFEKKCLEFEVQVEQLQKILGNKDRDHSELSKAMENTVKELNDERKTYHELNNIIVSLNESIRTLQSDQLNQKTIYESNIQKKSIEHDHLLDRFNDLQKTITLLTENKESNDKQEFADKFQNAIIKNCELETKLNEALSKLSEESESSKSSQESYSNLKTQFDSLTQRLQKVSDENDKNLLLYETAVKEKSLLESEIQTTISEKSKEITEISSKFEAAIKNKCSLEIQLNEMKLSLEQNIENQSEYCKTSLLQIDELNQKLHLVAEERDKAMISFANASAEKEVLESNLKLTLSEKNNEINQLYQKLQINEDNLKKYMTLNEEMKTSLLQIDELNQKLDLAAEERDKAMISFENASAEKEVLESNLKLSISEKNNEINQLYQKLQINEDNLKKYMTLNEEMKTSLLQIDELNQKLDLVAEERDKVMISFENSSAEREILESNLKLTISEKSNEINQLYQKLQINEDNLKKYMTLNEEMKTSLLQIDELNQKLNLVAEERDKAMISFENSSAEKEVLESNLKLTISEKNNEINQLYQKLQINEDNLKKYMTLNEEMKTSLEHENLIITQNCQNLLDEKSNLEDQLQILKVSQTADNVQTHLADSLKENQTLIEKLNQKSMLVDELEFKISEIGKLHEKNSFENSQMITEIEKLNLDQISLISENEKLKINLADSLQSHKLELEDLQMQLEAASADIIEKKSSLKDFQESRENLIQKCELLQQQVENLDLMKSQMIAQLQNAEIDKENELSLLNNSIIELNKLINEKSISCEKALLDKSLLEVKCSELHSSKESLEQMIGQLKNAEIDKDNELSLLNNSIIELNKIIDEKSISCEKSLLDKSLLEVKCSELHSSKESLEQMIAQLKTAEIDKENELLLLNNSIIELNKIIDEKSISCEKALLDKSLLEVKCSELHASKESLELQMNQKIESLIAENSKLENELIELKNIHASEVEDIKQMQAEKIKLIDELKSLKDSSELESQSKSTLLSENSKLNEKWNFAKERFKSEVKTRKKIFEENSKLKDELSILKDKFNASVKENLTLENENSILKDEKNQDLAAQKANTNLLLEENSKLKDELTSVKEKLETDNNVKNDLHNELKALLNELGKLKSDEINIRQALDLEGKEKAELLKENILLKQGLEKLDEKLAASKNSIELEVQTALNLSTEISKLNEKFNTVKDKLKNEVQSRKHLLEENSKLQKELKSLKEAYELETQEKARLLDEIFKLRSEFSTYKNIFELESKASNESLLQKYDDTLKLKDDLEHSLREMIDQHKNEKTSLLDRIKASEKLIGEFSEKQKLLDNEAESLRVELHTVKKSLKIMNSEKKETELSIRTLSHQNSTNDQNHKLIIEDKIRLEKMMKEVNEKLFLNENKLNEAIKDKDAYYNELNSTKTQLDLLSSELKLKEDYSRELDLSLKELETNLAQKESQLEKIILERNNLEMEHQSAILKCEFSENQMKNVSLQFKETDQQKNLLIEKITAEYDESSLELLAVKKNIKEITQKLEDSLTSNESLLRRNSTLEMDYDRCSAERAGLEDSLRQSREEFRNLEADKLTIIKKLMTDYDGVVTDLETLKTQFQNLKLENDQKAAEIKSFEKKLDLHKQDFDACFSEKVKIEKLLKKSEIQIVEIDRKDSVIINNITKKCENLSKELNEYKDSLKKFTKEKVEYFEVLSNDKANLQAKYEDSCKERDELQESLLLKNEEIVNIEAQKQKAVKELSLELENVTNELNEVKQVLQISRKENEEGRALSNDLSNKISNLETKAQTYCLQIENLDQELKKSEAECTNIKKEKKESIQKLSEELESLSREYSIVRESLNYLQKDNNTKTMSVEETTRENINHLKNYQNAILEKEHLELKLENLHNVISELKSEKASQIEKLYGEKSSLEEEILNSNVQIKSLKKELSEKTSLLELASQSKKILDQNYSKLLNDFSNLQEDLKIQKAEFKTFESDSNSLIKNMTKEADTISFELKKSTKKIIELEQNLEEALAINNQLKSELENFKHLNENQIILMENQSLEIRRLKVNLNELELENNSKISQLENEKDIISSNLKKTKDIVESQILEIQEKSLTAATLSEERIVLQSENHKLILEMEYLSQKSKTLADSLNEKELEANNSKKRMKDKFETLNTEIDDLKSKIKIFITEREERIGTIESLNAKLNSLEVEHHRILPDYQKIADELRISQNSIKELEFSKSDEVRKNERLSIELQKCSEELCSHLKQSEESIGRLTEDIKKWQQQNVILTEEKEQLQRTLKKSSEEIKDLEIEKLKATNNLNLELDAALVELTKNKESLKHLIKERDEKSYVMESVARNSGVIEKDYKSATSERDQMNDDLIKTRQRVYSLENEKLEIVRKMSIDYETLSKTLEKVQQNLEKSITEKKNLEETLASFKTKTSDLESNLKKTTVECDNLKVEIKNYILAIKEVESEKALLIKRTQIDHEQAERDLKEAQDHLISEKEKLKNQLSVLESITIQRNNLEIDCKKYQKISSEFEIKIQNMEQELFSMQEIMAAKDSTLNDRNVQIGKIRQQLLEEEEKKSKSIQLLRNSKARLIKFETELKSSQDEVLKLTNQLSTKETDFSNRGHQIIELNSRINDLESIIKGHANTTSKKNELLKEQELIKARITELESREAIYVKQSEDLAKKSSELEKIRLLNSQMHQELLEWPSRMSDYVSKVDNLEAELEISRKLFETKSSENEILKIKMSELEAQIYSTLESAKNQNVNVEELRDEVMRSRAESKTRLEDMKKLQLEIVNTKNSAAEMITKMEQRAKELDLELKQMAELKGNILKLESERDELKKVYLLQKKRLLELESEIQLLKADYQTSFEEKDNLLSDLKMRQIQFQNINKALKDEVRKLSRKTSGTTSPTSEISSPSLSRSNTDLLHSRFASEEGPDPEYLRHVFLKFLDKKDKRAQLLPVIGMILKFSPEEINRLKGKI